MQASRICGKVSGMRFPGLVRRGASAVAILVLLLAQWAALAHAAAVRHVRCAEHGELVEAPQLDARPQAGTDVRLVGARGGTSTDDHCTIAGEIRHGRVAPAPATASGLARIAPVAPALAPRPTRAYSLVYLLAPKTSPPGRWVSIT